MYRHEVNRGGGEDGIVISYPPPDLVNAATTTVMAISQHIFTEGEKGGACHLIVLVLDEEGFCLLELRTVGRYEWNPNRGLIVGLTVLFEPNRCSALCR